MLYDWLYDYIFDQRTTREYFVVVVQVVVVQVKALI